MIYISCNRRNGGGNRISVLVCEKVCGGCPDYDEFCDLRDNYIKLYFDEDICPACGGTGITEIDYSCPLCGVTAPWRFVPRSEAETKNGR
jgi:hypothetical protein